MVLRHGRLLGVLGQPFQTDEFVFRPARIEIDEAIECHPLTKFHRPLMNVHGRFELTDESDLPDALWIRSRLPGLFGYRPLQIAGERTYLLDAGFIASATGRNSASAVIPFAVSDSGCAYSHLVMSAQEKTEVCEQVARAFWGLLAAEQTTEQDFRSEGIEWYDAFDEGGLDMEQILFEVGRSGGIFYSEAIAYDHRFDPDFERPDRYWHRYRYLPSRPVRRVRRWI